MLLAATGFAWLLPIPASLKGYGAKPGKAVQGIHQRRQMNPSAPGYLNRHLVAKERTARSLKRNRSISANAEDRPICRASKAIEESLSPKGEMRQR